MAQDDHPPTGPYLPVEIPPTSLRIVDGGPGSMPAMDQALKTLEHEFRSEPGSFLLGLRSDLVWDRGAFSRLEKAMRTACERLQDAEELPRWLATSLGRSQRSTTPRA